MNVTEALKFEISKNSENCFYNWRFSVEVIVFIILGPFRCKLQCQSVVGKLVQPDARGN